MSGYVRGTKRDQLRFVPLNTVLLYGWKTIDLAALTGITQADLTTQLGHLDATAAAAVANGIMVLGANSPKPARVSKKFANAATTQRGSVSTYRSYSTSAAATSAQWTETARQKGVRLVAASANKRSQTAVAELSNGLLYAFPLAQADFALVSTDLGLQDSTQISSTEKLKLATGMKGTRPGKARITDSGGSLTTFFSTANYDQALAAGFDIVEEERIQYA